MFNRFRIAGLAAMMLAMWAGRVDAGLLPVSASVHSDGGNQRYTYGVVLTSDSALHKGDFFTVYNFSGLVKGSNVQPANFAFSTSTGGGTPSGITTISNPNGTNLTWTYTGANTITGQIGLGNFSAISTNPASNTTTNFAATTHRQVDGQPDSNITDTTGPGAAATKIAGVPEPASLALVGIGLPLFGFFFRRRSSF